MPVGIHCGVEIAGVLQIESQIDVGFRNIRLRLDAAAIGLDRAWRIAQVFADQSEREPSAAIARTKLYGLFKLSAGQLRFARLSQARSKRRSRFDEIGRRLKRSPESDDGLMRAVERLESGAPSRIVRRIGRRFRGARKGEHGNLRLASFTKRLRDLAPAIDVIWKPHEQVFKNRPRFFAARLDERHAAQEGGLRPIGGQTGGGLRPGSRLRKIARGARHARSDDQCG